MKKYRLKKALLLPDRITGSGCTYGEGTILTESSEFPNLYKVSSGNSVVPKPMVEGNSQWFEEVLPVSNEGVGRIEVGLVSYIGSNDDGRWYKFNLPNHDNEIDPEMFPSIKESIEDALNIEHDMGEGLMAMLKMKTAQYEQQIKEGKIYTQQEMNAARTEAFDASREWDGPMKKYQTASDYLSMSKYPASAPADKAEGERDWEILEMWNGAGERILGILNEGNDWSSYLGNPKYTIQKVRRNSDGEVFTTQDETMYGDIKRTIKSFGIVKGKMQVWFIEDCRWVYLTREDGYQQCELQKPSQPSSTEEAPLFVTEDGATVKAGQDVWGVAIQATSNDMIRKSRWPFDRSRLHTQRKWFSTEQAAHQYVIENKPCLSLNEVLISEKNARSSGELEIFLKDIIKSKQQ